MIAAWVWAAVVRSCRPCAGLADRRAPRCRRPNTKEGYGMPNFEGDSEPKKLPARAAARSVLAAGAGIAAGVSLAAAPAAAASAGPSTSQLGIAAHKPSSHHRARHHHSAPVLSPELLTVGDRGAAVSQVQRRLHRHATGYFGAGTRHAVARFQHRHHLTKDGVVGPKTRRAMHLRVKIIAPPAPAPARAAADAPAPAPAPVPAPAPAPSRTSTGASSRPARPPATHTASTGGYAIPSQVVQCESGGNPNAVSPFSGGGLYGIL